MSPLIGSTEANCTFVDGEEINFENGVAKVTKDQKRKLLKKPGYYDPDHLTKDQAANKGGISSLEVIYRKEIEKGNIPKLKAWLMEKISEIEPALLTMQQQQGQQMVENTGDPGQPAIVDEDEDEEDIENVGVDGGDIQVSMPDGRQAKLSDLAKSQGLKKKSSKKKKKKKAKKAS